MSFHLCELDLVNHSYKNELCLQFGFSLLVNRLNLLNATMIL